MYYFIYIILGITIYISIIIYIIICVLMKSKVILLTGTPGSGKTTIANAIRDSSYLNNLFNVNVISINDIATKNNLISGIDKDKNYKVIDPKKLDDFFKANIGNIINKNNDNDNNNRNNNNNRNSDNNNNNNRNNNNNNRYSDKDNNKDNITTKNNNNESIKKNSENKNSKTRLLIIEGHLSHFCSICDYVIVLRVHPNTLQKRLLARNYISEKVQENLESEALGVCLFEAYENHNDKVHELETTDMDINTIVKEISNIITGKSSYPVGNIDYMEWFMK